jgi:hypothetical protein
MRRALAGIVPNELLQRKRKAYVTRLPSVSLSMDFSKQIDPDQDMVSASLGIVVKSKLIETAQRTGRGFESPIVPLMRTLALEAWLQELRRRSLLQDDKRAMADTCKSSHFPSRMPFEANSQLRNIPERKEVKNHEIHKTTY